MALSDQRHTVRFPRPDFLVIGQAQTIKAPVYLDGELVAPASASVSIYNASDVEVVSASGGIVSSIAQYSIGSGALSSESVGVGWRVEWTLTFSDGSVILARNDGALVRRELYPPITDQDLYRRVPSLNPSNSAAITSLTTYQNFLDEAWTTILNRLLERGRLPDRVMTPSAFREVHLALTLALLFEDLSTRLSDAYETRADAYRRQYRDAWKQINFGYDSDGDGKQDIKNRRKAGFPSVWLTGRGN